LPGDIAVAIAFFNPCGYKRPIKNVIECATQFAPLPVYVLELGFKQLFLTQKLLGGSSSGVRLHQVKSSSVMFHKENLWMKIHEMMPKTIRKVIFLDGDIMIQDPLAWVSRVSAVLDSYEIVQPLSVIKFQENAKGATSTQALLVASSKVRKDCFDKRFSYPSPGYGIAVQRQWLVNVGGLVQTAVVGAGDLFMLGGLLQPSFVQQSMAYKSSPFAWADIDRFLSRSKILQTRVNFVAQEGLHLYHGSRENRQYSTRHEEMRSLMIRDLKFNKEKVLEFRNPEKWNVPMLKYFQGRKEDD
jgi:hypothetical protein